MTADTGPVPGGEWLRDMRVIADAGLSQLQKRDFLAGLLERVRETLQADTAAVLLLDARAAGLVVTAAAQEGLGPGRRAPRSITSWAARAPG